MIFTVAIDGPAAAGKGTVSRAVANEFGFEHLDTGLLYRAVGNRMLKGEDPISAAKSLSVADLGHGELRRAEVARAASEVAVIPEVRACLLHFQRAFARRDGGAVLDGRDIGTVICPKAEVKLFVTASAETRARRRHAEEVVSAPEVTFEEVLADVRARDERDMNRADAPLRPAADAIVIDTTEMSVEEAVAAAIEKIAVVLKGRIAPNAS